MTNILNNEKTINGAGTLQAGIGSGTDADPFIPYVTEKLVTVDDDYTGIVTIATAGTEEQGGDVDSFSGFMLKAHPDNTDTVWFMPHERTKAAGFPLNKGEVMADLLPT